MRSQSAVHTKFFNFISCDKFTIHKNIHGFMSVPREAWAISEKKTINEAMPMFKSSFLGLPQLRVFMVTKNHQHEKITESSASVFLLLATAMEHTAKCNG